MKTFRLIIIALACNLTFTACEDFLNITPEGQIKQNELLATAEGIEDALYGAYSQLRSLSLYGQNLSFHTLEVLAQTFSCKGNTTITALSEYEYTNTSVKSIFDGIWTEMYKNISNVNSILEAPLVAEAKEYPYTIYKGEALGLRAFMHFDLVRLFAEQYTVNPEVSGIPYATTFSLNTPDFEYLKENYQHILSDLHEAERLLSDEEDYHEKSYFMTDRQIHCNLHAVRALLARVYLTMGNKAEAAVYAKKVIEQSPYKLNTKTDIAGDVAGVLSKKETLFGIYYAEWYNTVYTMLQTSVDYTSLNPRGDIESIYDKEKVGDDYRTNTDVYFHTADRGGTLTLRLCKLTEFYELNGQPSKRPQELILGINLIRMPEMYYIVSEALLEENQDSVATWYFDRVLESRGLTPLAARQPAETVNQDLINLERFKEYIGEGQTFYNLKRQHMAINGWDISTNQEKTISASKDIYVIPIPDSEIENRF